MQADFSVELGGDAPALEIPWRSSDPGVRYYNLKKHPELVQKIPEAVAYPELGAFLSRINATDFPLATAKCDAWLSSEISPEEEIFGDRKFVSYVDLVFVDESERCSFAKHEAFAQELCRLLSQAPEIAATVELVIRHCYYHEQNFVSRNAADQDEQVIVPNHGEFAAFGERKQSGAQELDSSDLLHWDDSFKTEPSGKIERSGETERPSETEWPGETKRPGATGRWGKTEQLGKIEPSGKSSPVPLGKSGNLQLEPMPHRDEINSSITGFCLTAYVTGFGDCDHDPLRRWAIGLNLLQYAIVQLNSKLQPRL